MPLTKDIINRVNEYCENEIDHYYHDKNRFNFIEDADLKERLAKEFYMAHYVDKLQEALSFNKGSFQLLATTKFQIIQSASIMEAILSHVLQKEKYWNSKPVKNIRFASEYKPKYTPMFVFLKENESENQIYLCTQEQIENTWKYLSFEKKAQAAAKNEIITQATSERAIDIYRLPSNIHLEKAASSDDDYTLEKAKEAFEFLDNTFLKEIRTSLENNSEPLESQRQNKPTLMSKLRSIQIDAPEDFTANLDLYLSGEKSVE